MKKVSQKGFTLIEGLLILIALSLVVGVGYYVYNANQDNNITSQTTTQAAAEKPEVPTAESQKKFFEIKELGIKFELTSELEDLSYKATNFSDGTAYSLRSPSIIKTVEKCYGEKVNEDSLDFASISKVNGQFNQNEAVGYGLLKQFKSYHISIAVPNGLTTCTTDGANKDLVFTEYKKLQDSFIKTFENTALEI